MRRSPTPAADACYLGLDFGTSGVRLGIIGPASEVLFETHCRFETNTFDEWRKALWELLAAIPPVLRTRVRTIAICGTSGTGLLCDAAGEPLLPAVLYNETRDMPALRQIAPPDHLAASPGSSLAKLLWFAEQPQAAHARYFMHQADWIGFLLHGRAGISDYHNVLKLGYDVGALRYPDWLETQPAARLLPQVLSPGAMVGQVRPDTAARLGLAQDCRVRAGTTDSIAAFFASGAKKAGEAVTSLGSTLVLKLLSRMRVDAAEYGIYSHRCGNLWLAGGASNGGGAVLEKLFTRERLVELSAALDPEIASPLDYYPLNGIGERFPLHAPQLQARLLPRPIDDLAYLHGLFESLARIEARGYALLERLGATPVSRVFSAGGGATNKSWRRLRERVLQRPVDIACHTEAAIGTALLAAKGERLLYSLAADT